MWDHAAGSIPSPQRIREPKSCRLSRSLTRRRRIADSREAALVRLERVGKPALEKEPEPPEAPSGGPDETLRLTTSHYLALMSRPSVSPSSRSSRN
jgi:hypothetical protein